MLELLNEVVIQQAMFELIDRATRFDRQCFEPYPDQKRTRNMVTLYPRFATFAAFQTGHLFAFAVQLLNLPTVAARLLGGRRRVLSYVAPAILSRRCPSTMKCRRHSVGNRMISLFKLRQGFGINNGIILAIS